MLGGAAFGPGAEAVVEEYPLARVAAGVLAPPGPLFEVWHCAGPALAGRHRRVSLRHSDNLTFGCISVHEDGAAAAPQLPDPHGALHAATTAAYREVCAALDAGEHPHLLRVWNYVPDINGDDGGVERYRRFNSARQHALQAAGRALTGPVPAASALGAPAGGPVVVYFLSARTAPLFIENPRQVSAYHYPPQYGRHSPVFSRATVLREAGGLTLFISGTASIVGHRTLHAGDVAAQTRETIANIEALLQEANRRVGGEPFRTADLSCKVYVRHPRDLPAIQQQLAPVAGAGAQLVYLQADVCRGDLLVEIEAVAMGVRAPSA
ncbi:MAG: hypothetical protein JSR67_11410 [Proteobacteria bacterium]|nr:hypothetical protein [Pseudomonadota bacterium]